MIVIDRQRSIDSLLKKCSDNVFSPSQATRAKLVVHMLACREVCSKSFVYSNTEILAISDILDFWLYYKDEKQSSEL